MNRTHAWVRIIALALVTTVSLAGGVAVMSTLMSPSSATGAGLHGAWQEHMGMADATSVRSVASTIAAYPMPVLPQAHIPFVAGQAGPAPISTPTPTTVPIDAVLVPAGNGVAAFRIGRTEVTNAQYRACVEAGVCIPPGDTIRYSDPAYADHPVTWVGWDMARTYATWVGGFLPTEAQWRRACQGDDGRTYPWGNQMPDATLANYGTHVGGTTPVGRYPTGAGPYGALDMAGNVWEWLDDGIYVALGGAFQYVEEMMACNARSESGNDREEADVGFRVVFLDS